MHPEHIECKSDHHPLVREYQHIVARSEIPPVKQSRLLDRSTGRTWVCHSQCLLKYTFPHSDQFRPMIINSVLS
jgi:hypothetical protein